MRNVHPSKDKLYNKFKGGNAAALADLLEGERSRLYDYLMRMTGQVSRSVESVDEVFQSLTEESLEVVDSFAELRLLLYVTGRKFNTDIWNADTAKLANAAFTGDTATDRDRQTLALLDKSVRSLPGADREATFLWACAGFDDAEVAEVMGIPEGEAASRRQTGMRRVDQDCAAILGPAETALTKLPAHPLPPRSSQATINLSMVMQGIKTKPVGLRSPVRLALLILFAVAAGAVVMRPALVVRVLDAFKVVHTGTPE